MVPGLNLCKYMHKFCPGTKRLCICGDLQVRAIPLKKQEGERKISVTPSDKIGIFPTWLKTGFFLTPPRTQNRIFFTPLGHVFSCDPQTVLSNFTPLRQFFTPILPPSDSFLSILPPSDIFFYPFYPPRTAFFTHFTPSDSLFWQFYPPPSDTFSWDPLGQKFAGFTPQIKNKDFPLGQGDLTPSDKKAIYSPPSCFFNGIAVRIKFGASNTVYIYIHT